MPSDHGSDTMSDRDEDYTDVDELERNLTPSNKSGTRPALRDRGSSYSQQRLQQRPGSSRARSEVEPSYGRLAPRRRVTEEQYGGRRSYTPDSVTPTFRSQVKRNSKDAFTDSPLRTGARLGMSRDRTPQPEPSSNGSKDYFSAAHGSPDAHLSASFSASMPLLSRTTTYSSLPPSPTEPLEAFDERSLLGPANRRSVSGVNLEALGVEIEQDGVDVRRNIRAISLPPEDMLLHDGGSGVHGLGIPLLERTHSTSSKPEAQESERTSIGKKAGPTTGASLWAMLSEELTAEEQQEHFKIDGKW